MCPHTIVYDSSYYYIRVRISWPNRCCYSTLVYVSPYYCLRTIPHTTIYVSAYWRIRVVDPVEHFVAKQVVLPLYMCPHTIPYTTIHTIRRGPTRAFRGQTGGVTPIYVSAYDSSYYCIRVCVLLYTCLRTAVSAFWTQSSISWQNR